MPGLRQPVHGVTGSMAGCGVEPLTRSPRQSTGRHACETAMRIAT